MQISTSKIAYAIRRMPLTRRRFIELTAAAGAAFALGGCDGAGQTEEQSDTRQGFAANTEVKSYPVSLKVYADANLQWHAGGSSAAAALGVEGYNHLEEYAVRYRNQRDRGDVSFQIEYVNPPELLSMVREGFPDGDIVIGVASMLEEGNTAGTVDGGQGGYLITSLAYNFPEDCVMVRAKGSNAMLPAANTIDGNDLSDGTINRMQQLPSYDGLVAVVDPQAATEGVCANQMLAKQGLYSDFDGRSGAYADEVADKLLVFSSQDSAMEAVADGTCQLGFAFKNSLSVNYPHTKAHYPQVEQCYNPPGGGVQYSGAALVCSVEPGVVRDFLTFVTKCTD